MEVNIVIVKGKQKHSIEHLLIQFKNKNDTDSDTATTGHFLAIKKKSKQN